MVNTILTRGTSQEVLFSQLYVASGIKDLKKDYRYAHEGTQAHPQEAEIIPRIIEAAYSYNLCENKTDLQQGLQKMIFALTKYSIDASKPGKVSLVVEPVINNLLFQIGLCHSLPTEQEILVLVPYKCPEKLCSGLEQPGEYGFLVYAKVPLIMTNGYPNYDNPEYIHGLEHIVDSLKTI